MSIATPTDANVTDALRLSLLHFVKVSGRSVEERSSPHWEWVESRRALDVWPYEKHLLGGAQGTVHAADEFLRRDRRFVNFASQDYLGLGHRSELKDAALGAIDQYGVHSAGSPVLCGRTDSLAALERRIASLLGTETAIIYPTGWAAGFGVISGLARPDDTIALDGLSHNCLQEGAKHATMHVRKFAHNDPDQLEEILSDARNRDRHAAIFVIIESLYSMDSDSPDLGTFADLAAAHDAFLICDVAHDFGSMGDEGLGLLGTATTRRPDVIMGSFSKTFAANGGFVACSKKVRQYLAAYSSPHIFSNAISPIQTAIISRAIDIVFSEEGSRLRKRLADNVTALRDGFVAQGFEVSGNPSPITPVFVGNESTARLLSSALFSEGLLANLVEFPAVPRGKARFRFQSMATHRAEEIESAISIMASCLQSISGKHGRTNPCGLTPA